MSGSFNPYNLGGWGAFSAPAGQHPASSQFASYPSVFGALPSPRNATAVASSSSGSSNEAPLSFQFTAGSNTADLLNCIVMGPNARYCFSISTNTTSHQYPVTWVKNDKDAVVARIEWQTHPVVEIENIAPRALASQLIPMSRDRA